MLGSVNGMSTIIPKKKRNKSSLLKQLSKALTEQFLHGNVPLHNKTLSILWRRYAFNVVNDWTLKIPLLVIIIATVSINQELKKLKNDFSTQLKNISETFKNDFEQVKNDTKDVWTS